MNQFVEQIKETLNTLNGAQKVSIGVVFVLFIGLFVGLLVWANSETYETVFSSTESARIKSASEALEQAGVAHQISDDGTRIVTSKLDVGRARIISAST